MNNNNKHQQQRIDQKTANTLNNGLIGKLIDSNLPYFTWDDLSNRTNDHRQSSQQQTSTSKRIDLNNDDDDVLLPTTGASSPSLVLSRENHCTKNQIINNNNNFNSANSANYQNFHADRELEEEVELFENNQTELREHTDDFDEDEENLNDEILAGYTRNGTLQSNNYLQNATLGHRLLMMNQSANSTATVTSLQQLQETTNNRTINDDNSGGITNQAFIGLHSCYGYGPKCENLNCGNCGKAHLTANLGDHHINTSSSSWFSVASKSHQICSLGCCAIMSSLLILLAIISVVGISIYLTNITNQNKSNVLPLSGHLKIQSGDPFTEHLFNVSSKEFQVKATKYEAIVSNLVFFYQLFNLTRYLF